MRRRQRRVRLLNPTTSELLRVRAAGNSWRPGASGSHRGRALSATSSRSPSNSRSPIPDIPGDPLRAGIRERFDLSHYRSYIQGQASPPARRRGPAPRNPTSFSAPRPRCLLRHGAVHDPPPRACGASGLALAFCEGARGSCSSISSAAREGGARGVARKPFDSSSPAPRMACASR